MMNITPLIKPYAAKLSDSEYLKLRSLIIETIEYENKKRGIVNESV